MGKEKRAKKGKNKQPKPQQVSEPIAPIVNKLKTSDVNDRAWAATAIAHLIQDNDSRASLIEAKVIPALIGNIQDENERVVLESLGALRNVLVSVGQDACLEAMEHGAVTLVLQLLERFVQALGQQRSDEQPDIYLMIEQSIACLWSLAEYSQDALKQVSNVNIISLMLKFYTGTVSLSLQRISGQFLNTITDENDDIYPFFLNNMDYSKDLIKLLHNVELMTFTDSKIELMVLAGSILHNIKAIFDEKDQLELYQAIVGVAGFVLQYDIVAAIHAVEEAGQKVDQLQENVTSNELTLNMGDLDLIAPKNKQTELIDEHTSHLQIVQFTLELLTNMYSEDAQEWDDAMEEDDEVMEEVEENQDLKQKSTLLFSSDKAIFSKLVGLCNMPLVKLQPKACQGFLLQVNQVQTRALSCTNNLFLLGLVDSFNAEDIKGFWNQVFESLVGTTKVTPIPLELFESLLTLLFSISKTLQSSNIVIVPNNNQIQFLLQAASQELGAPESIKFKVVGILSLLARIQGHVELNQVIGKWIISQLVELSNIEGTQGSAVIAELLNAIYDIYADKAYDYDQPVFVAHGFNSILSKHIPLIQSKFKLIEKKQRDLREMCMEALDNLKAFVEYKRNE